MSERQLRILKNDNAVEQIHGSLSDYWEREVERNPGHDILAQQELAEFDELVRLARLGAAVEAMPKWTMLQCLPDRYATMRFNHDRDQWQGVAGLLTKLTPQEALDALKQGEG